MTGLQLYFLLMLDNITSIGSGIIVTAFLFLFFGLMAKGYQMMFSFEFDSSNSDHVEMKKVINNTIKLSTIVLVISMLIFGFIPNTKQAAAIYLIPKLANNERVQQIPDKALTILEKKLDQWISDMSETEN
jgi:hypothetical protein